MTHVCPDNLHAAAESSHDRERRATRTWTRAWRVAPLLFAAVAALAYAAAWGLRAYERHAAATAQYAPPPEGMVFVPAGVFIAGNDAPGADHTETPRRAYTAAFYIDKHEVTNAEYAKFDLAHLYPKGEGDLPVVKLDKEQARAYAAWAGKRLPTGDEWEKAARGTDGRQYPWGDAFDPERANLGGSGGLEPVGSYPGGASPYGALDMAGNAWEWVEDTHRDKGLLGGDFEVERGIIRGGAYAYAPFQGRCSYIGFESENLSCGDLGFRCAQDAVRLD